MIDDAYVFYVLFLFITIIRFLCWIYSHPLVTDWAYAPLWCRFAGRRSLVAVSLWGWRWSLLVYLLLLRVFIESML